MCGLVGIISKSNNGFINKEVDAFTELLYADKVRGSDGTGIFFNKKRRKPEVRILKAPMPSHDFIQTKEYLQAYNVIFQQSNFAIGHNRAATKGKIDVDCTHPFHVDHISLVHNGTLTSHKELYNDAFNDSHAIAYSIAKHGYKETLKKVDGAFALIWSDSKEGTLNICRNYQRPLHIIECTTCYIVVSEEGLGKWIAERNSLFVKKSFAVEPKTLYQFHIKDMAEYTEEDLEYFTWNVPVTAYPHGYNNVYKGTWNNYTPNEKPKFVETNKDLKYGCLVRFRAGDVCENSNKIPYLEGDILIDQKQDLGVTPNNNHYEGEWRLKFYHQKNVLDMFVNKREMIGVVSQTVISKGETTYTIKDVQDYDTYLKREEANKMSLHQCEYCDIMFSETPEWIDGFDACPKCAKELKEGSFDYRNLMEC